MKKNKIRRHGLTTQNMDFSSATLALSWKLIKDSLRPPHSRSNDLDKHTHKKKILKSLILFIYLFLVMFGLVDIFRMSVLGGSISSNPEKTVEKVAGWGGG